MLRGIEKHRLIFLYFARPQRLNSMNHEGMCEGLRRDEFPGIPSEDIEPTGEFLFKYRRTLDHFAQTAITRFGIGEGSKPCVLDATGKFVVVENGSPPYWKLDEDDCCYMNESSDAVLATCREFMQFESNRRFDGVIRRVNDILHDEGQSTWYASRLVQWSYLQRLDDVIHSVKAAEFA